MNEEEMTSAFDDLGWKTPPRLVDLKADLTAARSSHSSQMAKITHWRNLLHIKRGDATDPDHKGSTVCPKTIRRNNEWRYTSLSEPFLNTEDVFKAEPISYEDVQAAKQNGMVLNNQFNTKLDKVNLIDRYTRKFVDEGTAILRTGWKYETKEVTKEYPIYEVRPSSAPEHAVEIQAAKQADPASLPVEMLKALELTTQHQTIFYPVEIGTEKVTEEETLKNHPTLTVCNPDNVIFDPSCGDNVDDAQFVIYSFETSLSDLKKSGLYSNLDALEENIPDAITDGDHDSTWVNTGFQFSDPARKKMIAYEYWGHWDIDESGMTTPILVTWVADTIIRMEENPYPDKSFPFVVVPYLPVDGSIYGEPDGELIQDNQAIIGALTRGMVDLMGKSANGQTGIRKGALDYVNKQKFDAGLDYEYNDFGDAQQSIFMHTFPEIPMSAYNMLNLQNQEAEALTGVRPFAGNTVDSGLGVTAAHQNSALSASQRRELGILRRMADGLKKAAHKIIAMNQVFLAEEEVVRLTNAEFVTIQRDDLTGSMDISLSISTAEADEQKAQELAFMLQTTGQQFGLEMYKMIVAEIADLRRMPALAHQIRNFEQQPDPVQQMEVQRMQAEIEKLKAESQKLLSEADNKRAEADRRALDYVEEESGVTHAREMEKQGAQAEANMSLEALKAEYAKEADARKNKPTTNE